MALKAVLDKLDGVADALKGEYTEKDGKFYLSVEPVDGYELDDVSGLKNSLAAERSINEKTGKELGKFGSTWDKEKKVWVHTIDPVKAKEALGKYDEFMKLDPEKEADKIVSTKIESVKSQLTTQHGEEIKVKDGRIAKLEGAVSKVLKTNVAKAAILAAKGSPELLLPHVEAAMRIKETDDDFVVEIVGADGNVRIGDAKGNPMTVDQYVAEMRKSETFGRAFEGDGKGGTGKEPGKGGGNLPLKRSEMTPVQKAAYVQEHGQAAFLKLPK